MILTSQMYVVRFKFTGHLDEKRLCWDGSKYGRSRYLWPGITATCGRYVAVLENDTAAVMGQKFCCPQEILPFVEDYLNIVMQSVVDTL
jgi:hypothetical protein